MKHFFQIISLSLFICHLPQIVCYGSDNNEEAQPHKKKTIKQTYSAAFTQEEDVKEQTQLQQEPEAKDNEEPTPKKQKLTSEATTLSTESQATKSKEIGTWVGDKTDGILSLKIKYKSHIISKEIVKWHLDMGRQIQQILEQTGDKTRTNFIRARIDFVFMEKEDLIIKGSEIPIIFISGHSDEKAKSAVATLEESIKEVTSLPCIPIVMQP